jgi:hypothetical protein
VELYYTIVQVVKLGQSVIGAASMDKVYYIGMLIWMVWMAVHVRRIAKLAEKRLSKEDTYQGPPEAPPFT